MVTQYPQLASADTLTPASHRHQAGDGLGARVLRWIRQAYCGLHGHDNLLQFAKERMFLQCTSCGHESPGWELSGTPRPTVRALGARRRVLRPHLIGARRIA